MAQLWWRRTGSNRRPEACKATALPTELRPRCHKRLRGAGPLMVFLKGISRRRRRGRRQRNALRKEVIQPQVPLRLPCYDFTPVADRTVVKGISFALRCNQLPWCDGRCVQDPGTYSPRRADPRLLAIPASCTRVTEYNPN